MYFRFFIIISPWKRVGPSFEQTLHPRLLNIVNIFSLFLYYLPFEKGVVLLLYKLESPLLKDALYDDHDDNDDDRQRTYYDQKSSTPPSAQVSENPRMFPNSTFQRFTH